VLGRTVGDQRHASVLSHTITLEVAMNIPLFLVVLTAFSLSAQDPKSTSAVATAGGRVDPARLSSLKPAAQQLTDALDSGDLGTALNLVDEITRGLRLEKAGMYKRTSQQQLADLEQKANSNPRNRIYFLGPMLSAAYDAGDANKADAYAREILGISEDLKANSTYPFLVYLANDTLGRLALVKGDVAGARYYLLQSGHTKASPDLKRRGPNTELAKGLLEHGERQAVLDFLELCKTFWDDPNGLIDQWVAVIKIGRIPDFRGV